MNNPPVIRSDVTNKQVVSDLNILTHSSISRLRSGDRTPTHDTILRVNEVYNWPVHDQVVAAVNGDYHVKFEGILDRHYLGPAEATKETNR